MADQPPSVVDEELRAASADLLGLPDAHQLPLLPGEQLAGAEPAAVVREYRGRGRPPGSMNRANKDFRRFILSQHAHPGLALARTYDRPVELLAAELGCSLAEAYQLQIKAAAELLPYIEGKAPISVNVQRRNDVVLIMPGAGVGDEQLAAINAAVAEAEEIDWTTAEAGEVLDLTSFQGGPGSDVSPGEAG
jgi:hypothetical protein